MSAVFISYRRSGAKHSAYRLKDRLKQAFGADKVFIDLEDIQPGLPFADVIKETIARCSVILVVIGPRWLEMQDMHGSRKLDDVDDWVRQEIEAAMASDARVIPVLVDGAPELTPEEVPASLREFAGLQAVRLNENETYWHFDVDRLIADIVAADPDLKAEDKPGGVKFSNKVIAALVMGVILLGLVGSVDVMDQDSAIAAIVFSVLALALSIWGYQDVQAGRSRGRTAAISSIVLAGVVGLASIGSLPPTGSHTVVSTPPETPAGNGNTVDAKDFDPNTLPATASVPAAPSTPDISGVWLSSDGSHIQVNQNGSRFNFLEFEPSGGITATGSGVIRGNRIESEFQSTDNSYGSGEFLISRDGVTISGSYTERSSGQTFSVTLSRR